VGAIDRRFDNEISGDAKMIRDFRNVRRSAQPF
jgi:hypothetical protein